MLQQVASDAEGEACSSTWASGCSSVVDSALHANLQWSAQYQQQCGMRGTAWSEAATPCASSQYVLRWDGRDFNNLLYWLMVAVVVLSHDLDFD
jgi:hypothetical protein